MHINHHHFIRPKGLRGFISRTFFTQEVDKMINIVAILAPVANLPQLYSIWINGHTDGVSLISWGSFTLISLAWLLYGIVHNEKPLVYMYSALSVLQTWIVVGIIVR